MRYMKFPLPAAAPSEAMSGVFSFTVNDRLTVAVLAGPLSVLKVFEFVADGVTTASSAAMLNDTALLAELSKSVPELVKSAVRE